MEEFYNNSLLDLNGQIACTSAEAITLVYQELEDDNNDTERIYITTQYPGRFKEIKMVRAFWLSI